MFLFLKFVEAMEIYISDKSFTNNKLKLKIQNVTSLFLFF